MSIQEGARGRPRLFGATLALVTLTAGPTAADCPRPADAHPVAVRYVIDGDTVVLADGEHLRLVGINAPELAHGKGADEPGAVAAREGLIKSLADGGLSLAIAPESHDRHGRLLGSLYSGTASVEEGMVASGLAFAVVVPPNDADAACLFAAERGARAAQRGLWKDPTAWRRDAATLDAGFSGFGVIRGKVRRISALAAGTSIQLDGHLELWIPAERRPAFAAWLQGLARGDTVTVRGWVGRYHDQPSLTLSHPAMLEPRG